MHNVSLINAILLVGATSIQRRPDGRVRPTLSSFITYPCAPRDKIVYILDDI